MKIKPIAYLTGCYPEKFGIPRQPRLVNDAHGYIQLISPYQSRDFLDGLALFSHIWLIFGFHQNQWQGDAKVRPQRLGGNQKMGVFATRSPYRPNGLGLSAVEIINIDYDKVSITVKGHDLVNDTPIYDIKPYVPFTDAIDNARSSFAIQAPHQYPVMITDQAMPRFKAQDESTQRLIQEVIAQNPIPPFHEDDARIYGVALKDLNIRFQRRDNVFYVIEITVKST